MHSIKHQARNIAWRYGDGDDTNYNPFARRSRSYAGKRLEDEESGLQRRHTADQVRSDTGRMSSTEVTDFAYPQHSASSPPIAGSIQHQGTLDSLTEDPPRPIKTFSTTASSVLSGEEAEERRPPITALSQMRAVLLEAWINLLLPFVPAGFIVQYVHANASTVFVVNFIAIFPVVWNLNFAVDELGHYIGKVLNGLVDMSFNNAAQLITSVLLLKSRQIRLLQISLLGSILSNLLLMAGLSFFVGGMKRIHQYFNATRAQTIAMFLLLATLSLLIPTASYLLADVPASAVATQSRGTAVVVIISYATFTYFQLVTHWDFFAQPSQQSPKADIDTREKGDTIRAFANIGATSAAATGGHINQLALTYEEEGQDSAPVLTVLAALVCIVVFTTLATFNTYFATNSLQGMLMQAGLTETFVGIVLLPLLSCDPEAIIVARADRLDLSISRTLEACMQTALMVVPLIVILAWCMGIDDMTLQFDGFLVAAMFAAIIIVTYVVQEGKSNWLTGVLLVKVFVIISIAAYFIP